MAGVILLGSRYGKYRADGSINPIMGHNMSMVTLGGLVLWFGWFGFNPGSTMGVGDGSAIAHIAVTTNTAAAMAIISSAITSWLVQKKPDLSMIINGADFSAVYILYTASLFIAHGQRKLLLELFDIIRRTRSNMRNYLCRYI